MALLTDKNFMDERNIRAILFDVRLPRIFMAILIGMLLASSGTVVQTVFQNPLADPYIIGISARESAINMNIIRRSDNAKYILLIFILEFIACSYKVCSFICRFINIISSILVDVIFFVK